VRGQCQRIIALAKDRHALAARRRGIFEAVE